MSAQRPTEEQGSATVVMLAVATVVLVLTVSGLLLASAVLASHRARASADLAALAAAGVLIRGETPATACQWAARVAAANHSHVQRCIVVDLEVQLTTSVRAGTSGLGLATARSRAGPETWPGRLGHPVGRLSDPVGRPAIRSDARSSGRTAH